MKTLLHAVLGFLLATVVAWGGLLTWGLLFLDRHDSYWDRNPGSADTFFLCWLLSGIATAAVAAWLGRPRQ
jgi:hypothetical protein